MSTAASKVRAYTKVDVETASQGKLIVMLFNGAIKRAEEAKRQIENGRIDGVHNNLIRAQEILSELRSALNMDVGELAENLDKVYEYIHHLLVTANIKKIVEPLDESITLMTSLRDTWQDLFQMVAKEGPQDQKPKINQHGSAVLNMQG